MKVADKPQPTVEPIAAAGPNRARGILGNKWVLRALGGLVVLVAWQITASNVDRIFSAPPGAVARVAPEVMSEPDYLPALFGTLKLFFMGYTIAAILGVALGLALARFRLLDMALTPYLNALYASPLPALVPIITVVMGYQLTAKLFLVVLLAIFPILINAQQGAKSVDPTLLEVARSFRVSEPRIWRDIVFPSSLPYLIVGLRLGVARGMIGTAVAELYTSPDGLGYLIQKYGFRFDMDAMLVIVLTFTSISVLLSLGVGLLERRVERWQVKSS